MAGMGLEPRLARLCIAGKEKNSGNYTGLACAAAAILSEKDDSGINDDPDFTRRLSIIRCANNKSSWSKRILEIATDLAKRLGISPLPSWTVKDEADIGELSAIAFPERLAKRCHSGNNNDEAIFRFPSGRDARVKAPFTNVDWLCALECDSGDRIGFIRLAVSVSEKTALSVLEKITVNENTVHWKGLVPNLITIKKAGRIILDEKKGKCPKDLLAESLPVMLSEKGLSILPWNDNNSLSQRLLERIRFYIKHKFNDVNQAENSVNSNFSNWDDESLIKSSNNWLAEFIWSGSDSRNEIIDGNGLYNALVNRLGYKEKQNMDKLVPEFYTLPSGKKKNIDYSSGEPVLQIRIQEAFGISGKNEIHGNPIIFHLLSPAGRPVQITKDLDGFWSGSYADVRKDMKGRYPKHNWPENPKNPDK